MKILQGRNRHDLVAWGVWLLLTLNLARYVLVHGSPIPAGEEWELMPLLRADHAVRLAEVWAARGEHHQPLLVLLWTFLVGALGDLRTVVWLDLALLSGAAAACLRAARALRGGRNDFRDAVFPLAWMHGGHCASALVAIHLQFVLVAALSLLGLLLVARSDERPGPGRIAGLGAVACALPLLGIAGVAAAVPWIGWLAYVWRCARRSAEARDRRTGRLALASVSLAVATLAACVHDYRPALPAADGSWIATASLLLARGIGLPTASLAVAVALVVVALVGGLGALSWAYFDTDASRARSLGVGVALVATLAPLAWTGFVHASEPDAAAFLSRYGLLAAPAWSALALAAIVAWERRGARTFAGFLFLAAALTWLPNLISGEIAGSKHETRSRALEQDLASGRDPQSVAADHAAAFRTSPEPFALALRDLQSSRIARSLRNPGHPSLSPDAAREEAVLAPSAPAATEPAAARPGPSAPTFAPRPVPVAPPPPFDVLRSTPIDPMRTEDMVVRRSDGRPVLLVRDGAPLTFALGPAPGAITGGFGVQSDLVAMHQAPPVRFEIEIRAPSGAVTRVFQRTLDVVQLPTDAGEQVLRVPLEPAYANGVAVLTIHHEGEQHLPFAGYWRDVLVR